MKKHYRRGLREGVLTSLILWITLAGITRAWGIVDDAEAQVEVNALASEVIYLPLAMRQMQGTERVSVASAGTQGNEYSYSPSISGDGRYVAFGSSATNLVEEDTNKESDVFVHDRQTGITELVSIASDGRQGNGGSSMSSISADGRYVAFSSEASNLVEGDTNNWCYFGGVDGNCNDIFVHDREMGETQRVSVASDGTQGNAASFNPAISADGRFVAFSSLADNLVEGDTQVCDPGPLSAQEINCVDIFVHDRQSGITQRVSVASNGTQGDGHSGYYDVASISADGRYVTFISYAGNLVDEDECGSGWPVAQPLECADVFVHDRQSGVTELVSVSSDGTQGNAASGSPSISGDGRLVAFDSGANNLVEGAEGGVFVHDRQTGATELVSVSSAGVQGDGVWPSISRDGRYVSFTASSGDLVEGDTNGFQDVFVHDRWTGVTERVSVASAGAQANEHSFESSISGDGRYIVFRSYASNLVGGDTNGADDIFVHWGYAR